MKPRTVEQSVEVADERLDDVARILAIGLLRARFRQILKRNLPNRTTENRLELCALSSAHADRTSRTEEPT